MPRQSRIDAPGALHHIIARGIERKKIFQDSVDRDNFLNRLGNILTETQTAVAGCGGRLQNRTESFPKPVSIGIVFKNISSLDTPAYDMMQGTRRIYFGLTWYVTSLPQTNEKRNA
jgi:hypothetical protein